MFLERRFEQAIGGIFGNGAVPLRLKLWNGRRIGLCPAPTVTVIVPKMSALRYFISPDLNKLGEAFVEGYIRVEGSIHEIFRVAETLPAPSRPIRGRCTVKLCDYRDLSDIGGFDKIASVSMFEHVGLRNLRAYFRKIRSLLSEV